MPNDNEHPRYTDPEHPYSGSGFWALSSLA